MDDVGLAAADETGPSDDAAAGAPEATFAAVYDASHERLVRLAWLLTSSRDAAHDICHDVFVRAHARWAEIEDPAPYLRRAVVNGAADHHRRGRREQRAVARVAASTPDRVEAEDDYLLDLVAGLPFRQQAVVVLRFWGGLTERQIAEAVDCPPGSVGPTLTRALARLREELAP